MKIKLEVEGPILPGSVSKLKSQCGKANCACKSKPPQLHGPYYRWTGFINGKRTTKTISHELAIECEKRIKRYAKLQDKMGSEIKEAIVHAPWNQKMSK